MYGTDKSDLKKKLRERQKTPDTNGIAKKHIIMLKLLKQKVKYLVLVV